MAPSAISPMASPKIKHALIESPVKGCVPDPRLDACAVRTATDRFYSLYAVDGWQAHLQEHGYAIVKGAIPLQRAIEYQQAAYAWLMSFGTELNMENPATWTKANLPVQSKINTFHSYGVAHEKFMWDARMEPAVLDAFAAIWGTDELLASFDSLNVTLPNRIDVPRKGAWEHVDQSPLRRGLHCVQGLLNLSPSGPEDGGLVVYSGSHALNETFFDTQTDRTTWDPLDRFLFDQDQLKWFTDRGCKPVKVCAEMGDLILWDSRTIHYGAEPSELSSQIRTVIYAAYTPARLASPEQLALKKEVFHKYGGTTNWPHDNIIARETTTYLEDGTRDPRDRDAPLHLPEMSDKLLKLAGVVAY